MNDSVSEALDSLRAGRFVLIYDADGREEETDMVVASQFVTPVAIERLRRDAGGLICTTVDHESHEKLGTPYLSDLFYKEGGRYPLLKELIPNDIPYDTKSSFSITINHRRTFTGITDKDRALTISGFARLLDAVREADGPSAQRLFGESFRAPGHVHLLNCDNHLLSKRFGHTELSTALVVMAGLTPSATICEMMGGPEGTARRKSDAVKYAKEYGIVHLEGRQIIEAWRQWQGSE
ncbi:MAG: 3,4-dihydroxy-2-butanone-4-phosphate synthase [Thermoplasmata archaeon HGW-Thermoplasmata-1]|nr:MAG: 3,4-dihydroxy-2-butanone-4-phosphate synthase [Thermoplasmata archaeon HGW-Thermoplasmata-1]